VQNGDNSLSPAYPSQITVRGSNETKIPCKQVIKSYINVRSYIMIRSKKLAINILEGNIQRLKGELGVALCIRSQLPDLQISIL
jgi:hypothetical protein